MPFIQKSPLQYPINEADSVRRFTYTRAPTTADYKNFRIGDEWLNTTAREWWKMVYKDATSGQWEGMAGVGSIETNTGDSGGNVSPDAAENINFFGNTAGYLNGIEFIGDPVNNTMSARDLRNITKYVVDPVALETEYTTIQSALDAANTAGGPAAVYVRPGTYVENLTFYDGIDLWGAVGVADTQTCVIQGVHIPPATGTLTIRNIFLESATDVFNSAVAGTSALILIDCAVNVTNGYTFNLPNWTGSFTGFDIGEIGSTNDGWINNTGGAFVFMVNITMGAGAGNTCIISGSSEFYNTHIQSPITFQSTGTSVLSGGCWLDNTLTTADTATVSIFNSLLDTGANQAITHNSANPMTISTCTIDSTNVPSIGGTGTIQFGGVSYLSNAEVAVTITGDYTTVTETGTAYLQNISFDRGTNTVDTDGELIIGDSAGNPKIAGLTQPAAGLTITGGPGSITFALADDLAGIEALATTGIVSRTAADTYAATSITQHAVLIGDAGEVPANLGPLANGELVIGTGVAPVAATLTAGSGIAIANAAGSITIAATGSGLAWEEVTDAAKAMAVATAYGANRGGGVTFTLPATASAGTVMEIVGMAGLWVLAQNAGQTVYIGNTNTTAGVGGSLTATNAGDCIVLRCIVADTDWRVQNMMGNPAVV